MSSSISGISHVTPSLIVVKEQLKDLRGLYQRIEDADSIKKIEQEIRDKLYHISLQFNGWAADPSTASDVELRNIMIRVKKTFNQVQDQLQIKLDKAVLNPVLFKPDLMVCILDTMQDHLGSLRRLYHKIEKADPIEEVEGDIRNEIHHSSIEIVELAKQRPDRDADDFDDQMSRLKVTLSEVKERFQEGLALSLYNAISADKHRFTKIRSAQLGQSHSKIVEKIELYTKRAESLDGRNIHVKESIKALNSLNATLKHMVRLNRTQITSASSSCL